jgi:site-specific DNA-methyltransferase (adenine-specific)
MADSIQWLSQAPECSIHAIVTDPPYGVIEYEDKDHEKLRDGKGGVWRIPPTLDGVTRSPLPRFTVLTAQDREKLSTFFSALAFQSMRVLVPGGHIIMASNPLVSTAAFWAIETAGFEKRGEIIRVVKTLRGGDRPKGAEKEFAGVTVMPKSCWEPWGLFRKPLSEKTVAENLRKWGAGGLRRISREDPFRDLVECPPARGRERDIADHPSLKPQRLMRELVRAALPLGEGVILDPFNGSGSTLAAAEALGYKAVGVERNPAYFSMASKAIHLLAALADD